MASLDGIKFGLWNAPDAVVSLIKRWEPTICKTEKDFEKSLVSFLRQELPNIEITPQYSTGRGKADIGVGHRVIVEIKANLKSLPAYHRLVGQLTEYCKWQGEIVVLLVGDTCPDLKLKLRKFAEEMSSKHSKLIIDQGKMQVVTKS